MTAINNVAEDQGTFVQAFRENVLQVIGSYEASEKETEILKQMEACQKKLMELMAVSYTHLDVYKRQGLCDVLV